MIREWLKRRMFKNQLLAGMADLNPSPLGQVRPAFFTDELGKTWLLVECVPCGENMAGAKHGGWCCPCCEYDLAPREAHAMFTEARSKMDRALQYLEDQAHAG